MAGTMVYAQQGSLGPDILPSNSQSLDIPACRRPVMLTKTFLQIKSLMGMPSVKMFSYLKKKMTLNQHVMFLDFDVICTCFTLN